MDKDKDKQYPTKKRRFPINNNYKEDYVMLDYLIELRIRNNVR